MIDREEREERNRRREILRKLDVKLKHPRAEDDMISSYADFLKYKNVLLMYEFNIEVFISILKITNNLWETKSRISRINLIRTAISYGEVNKPEGFSKGVSHLDLDKKCIDLMFEVFKCVYLKPQYLTTLQQDTVPRYCMHLVYGLRLDDSQLRWIIKNCITDRYSNLHHTIETLLFGFPDKNKIISAYAKQAYNKSRSLKERASIHSWIIDVTPNSKVLPQTIINDYAQVFLDDQKIFRENAEEVSGKICCHTPFNRVFGVPSTSYFNTPNLSLEQITAEMDIFFEHLGETVHVNTLWAIGRSRLSNDEKSDLLIDLYLPEYFNTFIKICEYNNLNKLVAWLRNRGKEFDKPTYNIPSIELSSLDIPFDKSGYYPREVQAKAIWMPSYKDDMF